MEKKETNQSPASGKIKILFLAANPAFTPPLKIDEEIRMIKQKIRAAEYSDSIELVSAWAIRPDDLQQILLEQKPHIVHFSGHGAPTGELILKDKDGNPKPVKPEAIQSLFTILKDNIRIVFFNACYTEKQARAINEVIDCVIGMNTYISDQAATVFAASFYNALGFGRSVKEAFELGKTALMMEGIPEENTPKLLIKIEIDLSEIFLYKPSPLPVSNNKEQYKIRGQSQKSVEIKILHLSDLHFDSAKPKDTQIILDALWKDLDNFKDINFILFSGDLVKAGDKKDDFEEAFQIFIKPLLEKTNLDKDSFFIAPGNHDIQRSSIDEIIEEGLKARLINRDSLNSFLDAQAKKGFPHIERLDHFNEFKRRFNAENTITSNKLFSTHVIKKNEIKIGIACLNTCWRATGIGGGQDKGRLLIGERQIDASLRDIKNCDIKIALYHHSLDWLKEYDSRDARKLLSRGFDFIFCGHLHDSNLELVQSFDNKAVLIQGGCLYHGRSFYNGYAVLCFGAQQGKGTIDLRSYFDNRRAFDRSIDKCEDGKMPISFQRKKLDDIEPGKQYSPDNNKDLIFKLLDLILKSLPIEGNQTAHNIFNNKGAQIETQIGSIHISETKSAKQEAEDALKTGLKFFKMKTYKTAADSFKKAMELLPTSKVQFFYCLSFLSGKPIGSIQKSAMDEINNILNNILQEKDQEIDSLARIVLGIIRHDYYQEKNYHYQGIPSEEIFKQLEDYQPTDEEKQVIRHMIFTDFAKIKFNLY